VSPYRDRSAADMPTKGGWLLLIGGLLTAASGRLLGPIEFLVAGIVAVSAVALAVAVRSVRKSTVVVSRRLSASRVEAGKPIQVDLHVANSGRHKSPLLRLHDSISDTRGVRLSLAPIAVEDATVASYRLPTTRRGLIRIGPIEMVDTDPAGLARRSHTFATTATLLVHPPIEAVPEVRILNGHDPMMGDQQRQALGISDEEFDGLREYQPGDDLRKVHWPSSARHDELLVRQFQPPRHGRLTIVIDTRPPGDLDSVLDITTSIAASISNSVLNAGDSVRIQTTEGRSTGVITGRARLLEALEFLARLESGSATIHETVPATGGRVVAISANPTIISDPVSRAGLVSRLNASACITINPSHWGPQAPAATGGLGWAHLSGPGQLGPAWSRLWSRSRVSA